MYPTKQISAEFETKKHQFFHENSFEIVVCMLANFQVSNICNQVIGTIRFIIGTKCAEGRENSYL